MARTSTRTRSLLTTTISSVSLLASRRRARAHWGWPAPRRPTPSVPTDTDFEDRLRDASDLIRDQALLIPSCQAYFLGYGVDLHEWLAPHRPPYVVPRPLGGPFSPPTADKRDAVCGGIEGHPPFDVLFVDPRCFPQGRNCDLASLLLHELGHLARRDTDDHEPFDFFAACRLSACVDPARFR